jgi:hypothetical protein
MNMVQATGVGGVPANTSVMSGTVLVGSETAGSDQVSAIHGYLMAFATLVLGPLTMISTELLHKPRLLTIISIFFTLVALAGLVTGVFDSLVYNRVRNFGIHVQTGLT